MSTGYAVSDTSVMITRCVRRSLRDPEAFFTALVLPITLMLLFVYVFGGAMNTGGRYADYVVPGLIVLRAGFGLVVRSVEAANSITFIFMFPPYVSTAFVPVRTMPAALRAFSGNQPFTPVIETMRGLWMGHTSTGAAVGYEACIAVAYCVGILIAAAADSWLFRHRAAV